MGMDSLRNFFWKSPPREESHIILEAKEEDKKLYEEFMDEYNPSRDFKFDDIPFRKGAPITGIFGLDNGFKIIKGKMEWGYVRHHTGVDRARGGSHEYSWGKVNDIVQVPFNFNRSSIIDYGDTSYGTLISLFNDKYGFEFRIAHMNPDQKKRKGNEQGPIIQWSLDRLRRNQSFEKGWCLGSAGNWGHSSGAHTHTEVKSLDESCEVFDILLFEAHGSQTLVEFDKDEIVSLYKVQKHYKNADEKTILRDYNELRKERRILFLNRYKCQYVDWDNTIKTRYSSQLLFNGL